ncbi:MAG TPA: molybdenum cofactor guanylyltransferase [Actinomycetota bacterium]|nr:molybdenum cofactor guanylyltransferase [Actinomycetota bacterium]
MTAAPTAGVILAGGTSSRMGRPKALVPFRGQPMVLHVAQALGAVVDDFLVVTNDPSLAANLAVPVVPDPPGAAGPLAGIAAGLDALDGRGAIVLACDMPLVEPHALTAILDLSEDHEAVVPRTDDGRLEPLHAFYGPACREAAWELVRRGERRAHALADAVRTLFVPTSDIDPSGASFTSVDTEEALARLG